MVIGIPGAVVFLSLRTMTVIMKEKLQDYQCEKQHPTKDCSISLDSELMALKKMQWRYFHVIWHPQRSSKLRGSVKILQEVSEEDI